MPNNHIKDEELWIATIKGKKDAFDTLYNRYWNKLYQTGIYYLKDSELAEQVVQDVFITLWQKRKTLKIEKFANYIYIATKYHIFKVLREKKKSIITYIEEYDISDEGITYNNGMLNLNFIDKKNEIEQLLLELPQRCREIFWLSRIKNFSNEEIANIFKISKRTVENQISIASKHLKQKEIKLMK